MWRKRRRRPPYLASLEIYDVMFTMKIFFIRIRKLKPTVIKPNNLAVLLFDKKIVTRIFIEHQRLRID